MKKWEALLEYLWLHTRGDVCYFVDDTFNILEKHFTIRNRTGKIINANAAFSHISKLLEDRGISPYAETEKQARKYWDAFFHLFKKHYVIPLLT